jgi:hypothetical protein
MAPDKKMDLDEPVNVDMDPEDALRVLLGTEPDPDDGESNRDADEDDTE